jgi:hypothetical protein
LNSCKLGFFIVSELFNGKKAYWKHPKVKGIMLHYRVDIPPFLKRGPSLISQLSSREGQVESPSLTQERAKFNLPAFFERGPSLISQLSSREGQV